MNISVRKVVQVLHLWLGLLSGIVVFVVSITGCIYVFEKEIRDITQSFRFVEVHEKPFLMPSFLLSVAEKSLPDYKAQMVHYEPKGRSAFVQMYDNTEGDFYRVYINPYSGEMLRIQNLEKEFLRVVQNIHFRLLLPYKIGHLIVGWSVVVFLVVLILGLFLWFPRKKRNEKNRFRINWKSGTKRLIYDLHNVLGFYMFWVLLIIAVSGLSWTFAPVSNFLYRVFSLGNEKPEYQSPISNGNKKEGTENAIDIAYLKTVEKYPNRIYSVLLPLYPQAPVIVRANPDQSAIYRIDYLYFDQFSGKELNSPNTIYGLYNQAGGGDKYQRMNHDIHSGGILGFAGKLLAFLASLTAASLPVTGFLMWYKRQFKIKKKNAVAELV